MPGFIKVEDRDVGLLPDRQGSDMGHAEHTRATRGRRPERDRIARARQAGFAGYLIKPLRAASLVEPWQINFANIAS